MIFTCKNCTSAWEIPNYLSGTFKGELMECPLCTREKEEDKK